MRRRIAEAMRFARYAVRLEVEKMVGKWSDELVPKIEMSPVDFRNGVLSVIATARLGGYVNGITIEGVVDV